MRDAEDSTLRFVEASMRQDELLEAERPRNPETGEPWADDELKAAFEWYSKRELFEELSFELSEPGYLDDVRECLKAHPDRMGSLYGYVWSIYRQDSFNERAIGLIAEAAAYWLEREISNG